VSLLRFRRGDEQAGYREFEKKVIGLVRGYWRTNATASLDSALRVLAGLDAKELRHTIPPQQVTLFEGWLGSQDGFAIRTRRLKRMNRGYQVTVEQRGRPDVDEHLGSAGLAFGFCVSAVGPVSLPPFRFGVSDRRGNFCTLEPSNPVAEQVLESLWPSHAQAVSERRTGADRTPRGHIDAVTQLPSASSDESTWLAALVNRFPAEVYEVVQHSRDPARAAVAAALLGAVDSNVEWADRFGMLAGERPCGQRSDLVPLDIWRPVADGGTCLVTTPAPSPVGIKHGDVWAYRGGPEPLPVPNQQWLVVEQATVQDGGTILSGGRLVVYDPSADPRLDFVSGQWDSVFGAAFMPDRALVRLRESSSRRLPEGVLLSGRNDDNWYHWMVECLPRVFQVDSSVPSSAPFIVTSRTPPAGMEALERFADREIVVVDAALSLEVERLHVLAPSVQILDTTRVPWSQGLSMNTAPLLEFRRRLGLANQTLGGNGRRVFLQRTSSRRGLINQHLLAEIAGQLGLELVDPSGLSWLEQIELFSSSSLVVGASGAVMANYLLMPSGSRVLALTSDSLADFVLPAALAGISEAAFSYLTGPNESALKDHPARNSWLHSSFSIRPKQFERAVRHEIACLGDERAVTPRSQISAYDRHPVEDRGASLSAQPLDS
jgi:capsular polysaccharide biosynthesis protein